MLKWSLLFPHSGSCWRINLCQVEVTWLLCMHMLLTWWLLTFSLCLYYCGNLHKYTHSLEQNVLVCTAVCANLRNMWWVINDEFVFICYGVFTSIFFSLQVIGIFSWILSLEPCQAYQVRNPTHSVHENYWSHIADTVPMYNAIDWVWTSYLQQTFFFSPPLTGGGTVTSKKGIVS